MIRTGFKTALIISMGMLLASPAYALGPVLQIGDVSMSDKDIISWSASTDGPQATPYVDIEFAPAKGDEVAKMSQEQIGKPVKIMLCGKLAVEPVIREAIHGNTAMFPITAPEQAGCLPDSKITSPH